MTSSAKMQQSPLLRRKRDANVAHRQHVQVQWKFLKHQNPTPPSYGPPSPLRPPILSQTHSPSKLFQRLGQVEIDATLRAGEAEFTRLKLQQASSKSSDPVMDELSGETQRKELLDRIMAEMEAIAMEKDPNISLKKPEDPSAWYTTTNEDDDEDDEEDHGDDRPAIKANEIRAADDHHRVSFRKPSALQTALRASISGVDPNAVSLLPQRRFTTVGLHDMDEELARVVDEDEDDDVTAAATVTARRHSQLVAASDHAEEDDDEEQDETKKQAQAAADDDEIPELRMIRERQQRLRDGVMTQEPRVFWQKSARVRLALDIPPLLQQTSVHSKEAHRKAGRPRLHSIVGEQQHPVNTNTAEAPHSVPKAIKFLTGSSKTHSIRSIDSTTSARSSAASTTTKSPKAPKSPAQTTQTTAKSTSPERHDAWHAMPRPKPQYGAWYLPESQWWPLHQTQQHATSPRIEPDHCHHRPHHRHHRPVVPSSSSSSAATSPSCCHATPMQLRTTATPPMTPSTPLDPIAHRASVLQAEMPQSYIAKEYRNYILTKGHRMPEYLK